MILLIIKIKCILLSQVWLGNFSSWDSSTNQCGYYDICGYGSIGEISQANFSIPVVLTSLPPEWSCKVIQKRESQSA